MIGGLSWLFRITVCTGVAVVDGSVGMDGLDIVRDVTGVNRSLYNKNDHKSKLQHSNV
jgi:hypothetical protein